MALALTGVLASPSLAVVTGPALNAHIVGEVLVCNAPGHCLTRVFQVSAINSAGHVTAQTSTSGPDNRYRLRVPAGDYSLLATSNGLRCTGSAVALAHQTVTSNITCLVP
jgi:hypothetical protein